MLIFKISKCKIKMHSDLTLTSGSSCHSLITGLFHTASKLWCEKHKRLDVRMKYFISLSQEKGGGKQSASVCSCHPCIRNNQCNKEHAYSLKSHRWAGWGFALHSVPWLLLTYQRKFSHVNRAPAPAVHWIMQLYIPSPVVCIPLLLS